MSTSNDSRVPTEAQQSDPFAHMLSATHAELHALSRLLQEIAAQLAVVQEALQSALEPPTAPEHAGSLLAEMRHVRAQMLQRLTR